MSTVWQQGTQRQRQSEWLRPHVHNIWKELATMRVPRLGEGAGPAEAAPVVELRSSS